MRKGTPCVNCLPLRRERCQNTGTPDRDNTNTTIVSPDTNPNNHDSSHANHDSESANILGNDEAAEDESQSELMRDDAQDGNYRNETYRVGAVTTELHSPPFVPMSALPSSWDW